MNPKSSFIPSIHTDDIYEDNEPYHDIANLRPDENFHVIQSPAQTKKNAVWGDMIKEKKSRTLRLYFQNINGLSSTELYEDWIDIAQTMEDKQVDIYGLAETNIAWNPVITRTLGSTLKQQLGGGRNLVKLLTSSCDDPTYGRYQPGGVCLTARKNIVGRIGDNGSDPTGLGRWAYLTLQGKAGMKVVIITAYRLAQNTRPVGFKTAYNQQYRTLRRQGVENPDPKKQFGTDLLYHLKQWKQDSEIILMLDANGDQDDNDWMSFLSKIELYDVMGMRHGPNSPNTYVKGTRTIDYIMATKGAAECILGCGMLAFNDSIISDHRGLWVDLDIPQLLKGGIPPRQEILKIQPRCKHKDLCTKLRQETSRVIRDHTLPERIEALLQDKNMPIIERSEQMNLLDNLLSRAMLECLRKRRKQWPYWWTPEIHAYYTLIKIWKLKRNEIALGISYQPQIANLIKQLPPETDEYMGRPMASINTQLRRAKFKLKQLRAQSYY